MCCRLETVDDLLHLCHPQPGRPEFVLLLSEESVELGHSQLARLANGQDQVAVVTLVQPVVPFVLTYMRVEVEDPSVRM